MRAKAFIKGSFRASSRFCRILICGDISLIVIDGFVYLDDEGGYGLGGHLYECLERRVQIVGVAKSPFKR